MSDDYVPFEVDIDLENVETWDGEARPLVPIGAYKVEIVNVKNHGKRIEVKFKIVEGEQAGAFVWNNYQIDNDTGQKRMKSLVVACGGTLGRINSNELMGATLFVDVIHNEGKVQTDDMGNPKPVKTFANVVKERSLQAEESGGAEAAAEPEPEKPPVTRTAQSTPAANGGTKPAQRTTRRA